MPIETMKVKLELGQWLYFTASQDSINAANDEQKAFYEKGRFYLVISLDNHPDDKGRAYLVDTTGQMLDYCPRVGMLGLQNLIAGGITIVDRSEVTAVCGEEQMRMIDNAVNIHLNERNLKYFPMFRHATHLPINPINIPEEKPDIPPAAESALSALRRASIFSTQGHLPPGSTNIVAPSSSDATQGATPPPKNQ